MKTLKANIKYTGIKFHLISLFCIVFLFTSCEKEPETVTFLQKSDHFILHGTSKVASQEEIDRVIENSESLFPNIFDFLGDKHKPKYTSG